MPRDMEHRDFRHDDFRPYAIALGQIALAWNDLNVSLSSLFWTLLGMPNGLVPFTVWGAVKSDRTQRDMIRAAIATKALGHDVSDKARDEIKWLLGRADSLEDFRNDALHSPFIRAEDGTIMPLYGLGNQRAKKLKGKDLLKEFELFYETTITLREYAGDLNEVMRFGNAPWPDRPRLPNRGDTNDTKPRRPK